MHNLRLPKTPQKCFISVLEEGFHEGPLIVGKAFVVEVVGGLADNLGVDALAPATRRFRITVEREEMRLLPLASGDLALEREVVLSGPVRPVMPGPEGVVDVRIGVDRAR
jgi:hypothetical protein